MYIKKLEFLQNRYPKEKSLPGIILSDQESISVGTPIIAKTDPFVAFTEDENGEAAYYKDTSTRTHAEELLKEDPKLVNKILARSITKMSALHLFCSIRGYCDYNELVINGFNFHFRSEIPLIHDEAHRLSASRISDVFGNPELRDIGGFLSDCFKSHRYLNVLLTGLGQSMKPQLLSEINKLINALKGEYPHSKGILQTAELPRHLIDVLSISFYKLSDVIPIYDIRRTKGVVLEFTITTSGLTGDNIIIGCQTYRFIFSKYKDGVFTIDGEQIIRPGEGQTERCSELICNTLAHSMPHDYALKPKSKKVEEV